MFSIWPCMFSRYSVRSRVTSSCSCGRASSAQMKAAIMEVSATA